MAETVERLADAIADRSADLAEKKMREHVRLTVEYLRQVVWAAKTASAATATTGPAGGSKV